VERPWLPSSGRPAKLYPSLPIGCLFFEKRFPGLSPFSVSMTLSPPGIFATFLLLSRLSLSTIFYSSDDSDRILRFMSDQVFSVHLFFFTSDFGGGGFAFYVELFRPAHVSFSFSTPFSFLILSDRPLRASSPDVVVRLSLSLNLPRIKLFFF